MHITTTLQHYIAQALNEVFGLQVPDSEIGLQATRKDFEGSHTFVTFPFAKLARKSPAETADLIGKHLLNTTTTVVKYNVVQGFLNLVIADQVWLETFRDIYTNPDFGQLPANGQSVMVEYSSPNTNKPLHLGHLRNNFLGYSVAAILQANGYIVHKTNVVNDRGIHICKSMLAYKTAGNGETPQSSGLKGDHLIGKYYVEFDKQYRKEISELVAQGLAEDEAKKQAPSIVQAQELLRKWEQGDAETIALWKQMNGWVYEGFQQTYKRMGVDFDKFYYESNTYLLGKNIIEDGLKKGVFFRKEDGSVWADLREEGLDEKLVLRSDGTSVYITQDLGTAELKYNDFQMDKSIYVVGNEQDYHFQVLFIILKKLGMPNADGLYHLSYGMVDLPSGRMKSREGTVVDADDLMEDMVETAKVRTLELGKIEEFTEDYALQLYEMIGLGALKYFLLKVDPKKRMLFNPDESIDFQGHTASYIQYMHARTSAIIRKGQQMNLELDWSELTTLQAAEREVVALLVAFPDKIKEAGTHYAPSVLAQYVYDLSKEYSRFFTELSIFKADTETEMKFRVALTGQVAKTIRKGMSLLGIDVPERM
jgi:arginyl-tRNA synthetase